jgi:uncharacterized sulfatase
MFRIRFALLASTLLLLTTSTYAAPLAKPNVLWITCEDTSPDLGCYGDKYAVTPNLDKLASQGARFTHCFTHAGVCAPSRSGIITGMYPTSIATQHMRCKGVPPSYVKCFPEYLRAAGYYCTNNSKTDYQFDAPLTAWDENGNQAHWRGRDPSQPFFSVFNLTVTHESQIRTGEKQFAENTKRLRPEDRHDPAKAVLPPYYPDTPVVRRDWARYYDLVTAMDLKVADLLKELEEDGLADNTVVFFYGDHGRGLPRAKRWIYDSGIHVPLLIRWPGKIEPGTVRDDLVAFVDLAPTVLSIAGIEIPKHFQGQAYLGPQQAPPRQYIYAARDRMDERYDIIRAVRDNRYKYIRNYQPWKPYAQNIAYMNEMPTMQEWRRLAAAGELKGPQAIFFQPTKPVEELYDTESDPHEVNNLARQSEHFETIARFRVAHRKWVEDTRDLGLVPEPVLDRLRQSGGEWRLAARQMIGESSEVVSPVLHPVSLEQLVIDGSPVEHYWAMVQLGNVGARPSGDRSPFLVKSIDRSVFRSALKSEEPILRIGAAEALCKLGQYEEAVQVLIEALSHPIQSVRLNATLVLDDIGERARPAIPALKAIVERKEKTEYDTRVAEHILKRFEETN